MARLTMVAKRPQCHQSNLTTMVKEEGHEIAREDYDKDTDFEEVDEGDEEELGSF
ncbi:hypothetical protein CCACVL1_28779 [Corchorus capsularis]|uniref:Uncharacterized protein n=1 Tax=Corchorus capsularis TaxID=210143 RepID=A0A1R3G577_COCAP|nr:hypothetical protein CCACVL1_28779 [Corchorus capsularis]